MKGRRTRSKHNPINRHPVRCICCHPSVHIHDIPLRDLCHLRPIRGLSQPLDFLLWSLILRCRFRELQCCRTAARFCVRPDTCLGEPRRVLRRLRHCEVGEGEGREESWKEGCGMETGVIGWNDKSSRCMMRRLPRRRGGGLLFLRPHLDFG